MRMSASPASDTRFDNLVKYLDFGFAILPIWGMKDGHCACPDGAKCQRSPGKHPNARLVPQGVKNATRDKSILREWFRRFPNGNWAIRSGEAIAGGGYLVVLDVDPRNGGDASLGQLPSPPPETWTQESGGVGGRHYLLRSPTPADGRTVGPGLDLIGQNKYILVDPSVHPSGNPYIWSPGKAPGEIPIADAPPWLLNDGEGGVGARPVRLGDGTARDTVLGEAFALAGMLGVGLADGSVAVKCPWADEHSDARGHGEDSSTVILPPAGGSRFGGFSCKHSHCAMRKWHDVLNALPISAVEEAKRKYPMRPQAVNEAAEGAEGAPKGKDPRQACKEKLLYTPGRGNSWKIKPDIVNAITILIYDPRWAGILQWDNFSRALCFTRPPPWHTDDAPSVQEATWLEEDGVRLEAWMRREWSLELPVEKLTQAAYLVGRKGGINPLVTWLDNLTWDGTPRLDTWGSIYLGAEDNPYVRTVCRKWMISAVARAYDQGCEAHHALVLEGPQGRGKSTALRTLVPVRSWFSDTPIDIGNKDAFVSIRGKWIIELAELAALNRKEIDKVKAFFTSATDSYRPPYGRDNVAVPRTCVFAGTVNNAEWLKDQTGNRRFWPLRCGVLDIEALDNDRDQLWAEAVSIYKDWKLRGSPQSECLWWPTPEEIKIITPEQEEREEPHPWTWHIYDWLRGKSAAHKLETAGYITTADILTEALKIEPARQTSVDQINVGYVMIRKLNWIKIRPSINGVRTWAYRPSK